MKLEVDIKKELNSFALRASFETGEGIHGILGGSGAGKSMALKCIAGIETPDSGRIVLDGETLFDSDKRINLPPQKRRVGYLFQSYALFPNMTVEKNILCGLHTNKDSAEKERILKETLAFFRLEDVAAKRPSKISGGQAQRTALARIMVNRPKLLLLDEPFSALDSHLRLKLEIEMKELLTRYEGTVLMVTHSRDEAYHMCKSISIVDQGQFGAFTPVKNLFANPRTVESARITGCKNIAAAVRLNDHEVEVPEWGVHFTAEEKVEEGLKGVGIRAHYFNARSGVNSHAVQFVGEMEEPFEWILLFKYEGQSEGSEPLWWRLPKDKRPAVFPEKLGIAPVNILLLYE